MKPVFAYLLVAFLCLPVLFINIKSSHDWGDDFAQYIHQAKNLVEGIPQTETGYIFNEEYFIGPPAYPVGFPLLLAPIYKLFGTSIYAFNLYISFYLFFLGILMFHFLRKHFNDLVSAFLVIVFLYNPSTLSFKTEIMSDIPFSFFLLLCLLLYQYFKQLNLLKVVLLSFLIALLISIRNIGMVFVITIIVDASIQLFRHRKAIKSRNFDYKNILLTLMIAVFGFIGYYLLNNVIFHVISEGLFSYNCFSDINQLYNSITNNLNYNLIQLRLYFEPYNGNLNFVSIICGSLFFTFSLIGIVKKIVERIGNQEIFICFYLAAVLLFPYSGYGFRFLLPLFPLLLYYFVIGFKSIQYINDIKPSLVGFFLMILTLISYQNGLVNIFINQSLMCSGPQEDESKEVFNYIIDNTTKGARFNFIKPRALAFYINRTSMGNPPKASQSEIYESMIDNNIDYILINKEISYDSTKIFVKNPKYNLKELWANGKFTLYKR